LRRTLSEAGLTGHSLVLGQVSDVDDVVAAADVVVLLTRDGGLPEALVLAAAAGVPFVSYDVDGARELRQLGADGILVAPGDVEAAAGVVEHLLAVASRPPAIDATPWSRDTVLAGYRSVMFDALTS
jgi:glycosyltransferase involved in cell wall biosynthesis